WLMMSLWDALRMNMMISYQELVRTFLSSFNVNVANMRNFFAPMFTFGKYYNQDEKVLLPFAVQVHHSVCDGFHVARMINELQELCDNLPHHSEAPNV
ncbi:CatA-like O-acetyltransferase, partial [Enterobacter hormaechei subsp. xiangfangensis]|uniref:CatA-like O-acetyltransferase n=1 Tax=Enterobacter hormaechei TaxID=158836 RepID=UPI002873FD1E